MELLRTDLKQRYQKYYLDASITPPKKVQIHTVTRRRLFHFSKQKSKIFLSKRKRSSWPGICPQPFCNFPLLKDRYTVKSNLQQKTGKKLMFFALFCCPPCKNNLKAFLFFLWPSLWKFFQVSKVTVNCWSFGPKIKSAAVYFDNKEVIQVTQGSFKSVPCWPSWLRLTIRASQNVEKCWKIFLHFLLSFFSTFSFSLLATVPYKKKSLLEA